jgi:hypothetical protein
MRSRVPDQSRLSGRQDLAPHGYATALIGAPDIIDRGTAKGWLQVRLTAAGLGACREARGAFRAAHAVNSAGGAAEKRCHAEI